MKKLHTFAAAGILAATALVAGQAAAENGNSAFAQATHQAEFNQAPLMRYSTAPNSGADMATGNSYGYGYESGAMTRMSQPEVTVYHLRDLSKAERVSFRNSSPSEVRAVQADIRADSSVRSALVSQNVQVSNVIGVIHGADGSTAYVVR